MSPQQAPIALTLAHHGVSSQVINGQLYATAVYTWLDPDTATYELVEELDPINTLDEAMRWLGY